MASPTLARSHPAFGGRITYNRYPEPTISSLLSSRSTDSTLYTSPPSPLTSPRTPDPRNTTKAPNPTRRFRNHPKSPALSPAFPSPNSSTLSHLSSIFLITSLYSAVSPSFRSTLRPALSVSRASNSASFDSSARCRFLVQFFFSAHEWYSAWKFRCGLKLSRV